MFYNGSLKIDFRDDIPERFSIAAMSASWHASPNWSSTVIFSSPLRSAEV